jgi:hypothetical protein
MSSSGNNTVGNQEQSDASGLLLAGAAVIPPAAYATYLAFERSRRVQAVRTTGPNVMPEPKEWLDRGFNLGQSHDDHLARWFGPQNPEVLKFLGSRDHDAAHIIFALSGAPVYQGDFVAEVHVIAMQGALHRPIGGIQTHDPATLLTQKGYIQAVRTFAEGALAPENMTRTIMWIMGGRNNQSMDAIYRSYNFDGEKMLEAAKQQGITLEFSFDDGIGWEIKTPEGKRYTFNYGEPAKTVLPHGTNGVENFRFCLHLF